MTPTPFIPTANQIKINQHSPSYLIGTDGNDRFDANYYSAYNNKPFNLSLLVNFLGGGGDDLMGGSGRSDNLWGGTGNDVLWGYTGDDNLYGESCANLSNLSGSPLMRKPLNLPDSSNDNIWQVAA